MRVSTRSTRAVVAGAASVALLAGAMKALGPVPGGASSHREAPLISADPQVDTTDVYAFRSPDDPDTVTLISSWLPFEEPAGGPNFYAFDDQAVYDLNVDNDGDARPDLTFRFDFADHYRNLDTFLYNTGQVTALDDPDLNFFQTYDLRMLTPKERRARVRRHNRPGWRVRTRTVIQSEVLLDDAPVAPSHVGDASMPDYTSQLFQPAVSSFGAGSAWAGQSDDPFFLDLRIFDLLYGADLSEVGDETLDGFNVQTLAMRVPRSMLAAGGDVDANPIIGVWATASRPRARVLTDQGEEQFKGRQVQVSRLGMPLVNEAVIPLADKDLWNGSRPTDDGQFLSYVVEPEVPELIEAIYGIPAPATPRNDLVAIFLTGLPGLNQPPGVTPSEMIRLNMTTPLCEPGACADYSRLGVIAGDEAGYPNGRRLADDVIDITLTAAEQTALGDGVDENPEGFRGSFPYVQVPTSGSDPDPH